MARRDSRIALLLEVMDQAYEARGWHGTTLRGALRGLGHGEAQWRPGRRRHCVWEIVLHAAYWKYAVRRRLERGTRGGFPRRPSNWPRLPARRDAAAWLADVALLDAEHAALRAVVERLRPERLGERSAKQQWRNVEMIHGVAAHDLYHTGQIQLLKKLMGERP